MLGYLWQYVRAWDWRLFLFILLFIGLPNIYQLYRIYLIGNELPDPGSLAIVSQWQFVGLVVEIFQEATVLAIFFFLGSQLRSGAAVQLDRAKSVLTFIFLASLVFSAAVFVFRDAFITLIGTSPEIQEQTRSFLGISIFSIPFTLLAAAIVVLFEALNLRLLVLILAVVNLLLRFALDSLFFGGYAFSLAADVQGVAWATLLSSVGLFVVGLFLLLLDRTVRLDEMKTPTSYVGLFVMGLTLLLRAKAVRLDELKTLPSFADMRQYLRVGLGSGLDSLIRNVAYFFMIIRIVNAIGPAEIGGYYLTIQILWGFMLVPVLAFADSAKALVANAAADLYQVRRLWLSAMTITAAMMLIWIALLPAFPAFARFLNDDPDTLRWAATAMGILFVPYVLFSFNTVIDSVFYGIGKTKYLAYQALLTNGTVYLAAFLFYAAGWWQPTFAGVMFLFALGILVDSILTLFFLVKVLYVEPARTAAATAAATPSRS